MNSFPSVAIIEPEQSQFFSNFLKDKQEFRQKLMQCQDNDPLLHENESRWVLFPIQYNSIWEKYKNYEMVFWTAEDIQYENTLNAILHLPEINIRFLKNLLSYWVNNASNALCAPKVCCQFLSQIQVPEGRSFFGYQCALETIHQEVFENLFATFCHIQNCGSESVNHMLTLPEFTTRSKWIALHLDPNVPFAERLVVFFILKRVFTLSMQLMASLEKINSDFSVFGDVVNNIIRDSFIQGDFFSHLYLKLKNKLVYPHFVKLVLQAIVLEKQMLQYLFFNTSLYTLQDIEEALMYVANQVFTVFGEEPYFSLSSTTVISKQFQTHTIPMRQNSQERVVISTPQSLGEMRFSLDEEF